MILLLLACARPLPCASFCQRAEALLLDCAEEQGLDIEAMGFSTVEDFRESCATWAWEARRLEREAGAAQARCEAWEAELVDIDEGQACATWAGIDWGSIGEP